MKNPDIAYFSYKDLYISPMSLEEPSPFPKESIHSLKKGVTEKISGLEVEFVDFDFGNMQKGGKEMASGNYTLGAVLKVRDGQTEETINVRTQFVNGAPSPSPVTLQNNKNFYFYFLNMSVKGDEQGGTTATVSIIDPAKMSLGSQNESFVITAAVKPFISVLWSGILILCFGFVLSIIRRRKELGIKYPDNPEPEKNKTVKNKK
jgi:hypothetical protein